MAIEKITAPSETPAAVADWEAVLNIQAALLLAVQGAERIVGSNVVKGAVFLVGGATYLATADTAITGSASDYVKLTVSLDGLTLAPSYVADLTGVAWDSANNGYYDVDGNLYEFDELKALAGAAIAAAALRAIGGKNLGTGWAVGLTSALGTGWDKEFVRSHTYQAIGPIFKTLISSPTARSSTSVGVYEKKKEIIIDRGGSVDVSFTLGSALGAGGTAYGVIAVNGVVVGTERSVYETSATFTEGITVAANDLIQIYIKTSRADRGASVSDFLIGASPTGLFVTLD